MSETITRGALLQRVSVWIGGGKSVIGPRQVKPANGLRQEVPVQYGRVTSAEELLLSGDTRPANSLKEFFFPRHEKLYGYQFKGRQIELTDTEQPSTEQIIVGGRPCDAAALPVLDHLFNWDYRDETFNRRRELTTIVTIACRSFDSHCFCTSVGSSPVDARGSDVLLLAVDAERYEVRFVTEKGRRLLNGATTTANENATEPAAPPKRFEMEQLKEFLAGGYERPEWKTTTLRCLGCGACAYTCPTCHCFDIVDEGNAAGGLRARNWDACQFGLFTLHASGHNPRHNQAERQRQRIHHKFQIYPDKFGETLCTGCGNCTRNCPVGLGVLSVVEAIAAAPRENQSQK